MSDGRSRRRDLIPLGGPELLEYDLEMMDPGVRARPVWSRGALAVLLLPCLISGAQAEFGKVTLKTGEVIQGDVAKDLGDGYILRTADGLRAVAKDSVSEIVPAAAGSPRPAPASKDSPPPVSPSPPNPAPRSEPAAKASPKADAPAPKGADAPKEALPPEPVPVVMIADKRIEDARTGGPPPTLEITLAGTLDGKPVNPYDPLTLPRLTFFFTKESQPKFEVLLPPALRPEKSKSAPTKASGRGPAEYSARLSEETGMMDIKFYGTTLQKKARGKLLFELVRASDKKVVVRIDATADEDGEPEDHEKLCRAAHERTVKLLVERLKALKIFGGSSAGSEASGVEPHAAGQ